jgi:hypothetical protein
MNFQSKHMLALSIIAAFVLPMRTSAQTLRDELIGTWTFTATSGQRKDGTKFDLFGSNPNGVIIFNPDGHFALINTKPGRPKYAKGNRMEATDDEYKTTVQGSIAYFGTNSVDDAVLHVPHSREHFSKLRRDRPKTPIYESEPVLSSFTRPPDRRRIARQNL